MENDLATKLQQWFEASEETSITARANAERNRDYYDGKQLTDAEIKTLKARGQPPVISNRIKRKIAALKGIEQQQRSDPRAFPRTPQHEDSADTVTDALRFVVDNNQYDQKRSEAWENILIEGIGIQKVTVFPGAKDVEIIITQVPWDRYFYDPHSSKPDFSDATYNGEVIWMDFEAAKRKWPDKTDIFEALITSTSLGDTYDDKPKTDIWADGKRRRVRVIQTRWKTPKGVRITTSTKGGMLRDGLSPYVDEDGTPATDLFAVSAYVDRDNNRYGEVSDMISQSDEINKRRSKALHLVSMRQTRIDPSRLMDQSIEEIRTELAKPDGVIVGQDGAVEVIPTGDMAAAQFQLLQESKSEIDLAGPNPSLQGRETRDLSGRALISQQNAGLLEIRPLLDRKKTLDLMVYRAIWDRIRQFWTEERWIRVTDDNNGVKFVGLNRQLSAGEVLEKEFGGIPQELQGDPRLELPVPGAVENNIEEIDVDIIIEEGPDSITVQAEQFEQLTQLAQAGIPIPPDVIIEASSLRNKQKLLEMMRGGEDPEAQQQQQEIEQTALQLQFQGQAADIEKTESEAALNQAKAVMEVSGP